MAETLNVAKFFSKKNEEEGIWYEPKVMGVGTGFEVKVYGPNSTPAAIASDKYQKSKDEIAKIEDLKARNEAIDKSLAEYAASLICDIRALGGKQLVDDDGNEVTIKDMKNILYNAPIIASDIARFETNQNNFLSH